LGRNRRRRNQRRRREARDEQPSESERAGWRQTIDSLGGFTVVGTLGAAVVAVLALIAFNLPGSEDPNDEPYVPIERSMVSGRIDGDPLAPVRIIEFSDFQCPFCERFTRETAPLLLEEYVEAGQASIEYRHFAFLGPESQKAAEAAECALDQGHFWDFHDLLFLRQNGENRGTFSDGNLKDFARELAVEFPDFDVGAFDRCLDSGAKEQAVREMTSQGGDLGIQSTPSFIINGQRIGGAQSIEVFREVIDAELAQQ
jgi:protein-disulfide isomerase